MNCNLIIICISLTQDDTLMETVDDTEDTSNDISNETEKKESGSESVCKDMDIAEDSCEGNGSTDCIPEEVLVIDSEDGIDEDTVSTNEAENDEAKPHGINILFFQLRNA